VRHEANRHLRDLTPREWALLAPVLVLIVWIGVYPRTFTGMTEATVQALITQVESKASVARAGSAATAADVRRVPDARDRLR
jgi:NADH-quinone oxidoreductase subunit M